MMEMAEINALFMPQTARNHTIPFGAAHTNRAHVREWRPGPGPDPSEAYCPH